MDKHVTIVAALHIGLSILCVCIGIIVFFVLAGTGIVSRDEQAMWILTTIGTAVAFFLIIISIPGIIGGIGLLKRKNWARILILVVSVIDLLNVPLGTALGIYSIWILIQDETVEIFTGKNQPATA